MLEIKFIYGPKFGGTKKSLDILLYDDSSSSSYSCSIPSVSLFESLKQGEIDNFLTIVLAPVIKNGINYILENMEEFKNKFQSKEVKSQSNSTIDNTCEYNRIPHLCPSCSGRKTSGVVKKETWNTHKNVGCTELVPHELYNLCMTCKCYLYYEYKKCEICKGKGIVWG